MYQTSTVANYIIQYTITNKLSLSNLKLQKVLYFVQAQFLVNKNKLCFNEQIKAFSFGPILESVYNDYKFFGSNNINVIKNKSYQIIEYNDQKLIDEIIEQCNNYSNIKLLHIIYRQTPFKNAFKHKTVISNEDLLTFFK